MLKQAFLALSQQGWLRSLAEQSPIAQKLTSRFVAGRTQAQAIAACLRLNQAGVHVTLDRLGENVTTVDEARNSVQAYCEALHACQQSHVAGTVSLKLTQFGLDLSEQVCRRNVLELAEYAKTLGRHIEIDMESSAYTDRTLEIVHAAHAAHGNVRSVIQAYLFRSEKDIQALNQAGIAVRLCKGAYLEPSTVAFAEKAEVDRNYQKLTRLLLTEGTDPAIASHDVRMIRTAQDTARELGLEKGAFEFQMLYGIRRDLQEKLIQQGYRMRAYVPFGDAWYPYFMRRLAERPANVLFLARSLLHR